MNLGQFPSGSQLALISLLDLLGWTSWICSNVILEFILIPSSECRRDSLSSRSGC